MGYSMDTRRRSLRLRRIQDLVLTGDLKLDSNTVIDLREIEDLD